MDFPEDVAMPKAQSSGTTSKDETESDGDVSVAEVQAAVDAVMGAGAETGDQGRDSHGALGEGDGMGHLHKM